MQDANVQSSSHKMHTCKTAVDLDQFSEKGADAGLACSLDVQHS